MGRHEDIIADEKKDKDWNDIVPTGIIVYIADAFGVAMEQWYFFLCYFYYLSSLVKLIRINA